MIRRFAQRLGGVALSVALLAAPCYAGNWVVDSAASSLTFTGKQADEAFKGGFKRFIAEIQFDEAALATSHIQITIDMTSATIDGPDRAEALPTRDWFASADFPHAEFTSTAITKTGDHAFAAAGKITLRGMTKEITLPFTLTPVAGGKGKAIMAEGSVTLNRRDFSIGQGQWADDKWIAYPVVVSYRIRAAQ